jgi:hypothetical protein
MMRATLLRDDNATVAGLKRRLGVELGAMFSIKHAAPPGQGVRIDMAQSSIEYRVRLTAADDKALRDLFPANRTFDRDLLAWQFRGSPPGTGQPRKSAGREIDNWGRDPEIPSDVAIAMARSTLEGLGNRIIPAKSITVLPLGEMLAAGSPAITPELAYLSKDRDFYYLRQILHAEPRSNERITEVLLRLTFPPSSTLLTWAMWPITELETTVVAGGKVDVALNAGLDFEVPLLPVALGQSLGGGARADAEGRFFLHREWRRVKANVLATGKQDGFAQWSLRKTEAFMGDVEFLVLLCAPKRVRRTQVELTGKYKIRPHWYRFSVPVEMNDNYHIRLPSSKK